MQPGGQRDTQLKDVLWELSTLAHVGRADRRAVTGDARAPEPSHTVFHNGRVYTADEAAP